ncbi:MAG: acetyltransferase [Actinobacteria bacterium]|nr:acetyltransferase [Actinomycetota bacterium]
MNRAAPRSILALVALSGMLVVFGGAGAAEPESGHFVDPTARLINAKRIHFGELVYVAPFATLKAGTDGGQRIVIGDGSDVQDNVLLDATGGTVRTGRDVIIAHGASVLGPAEIGVEGTCPEDAVICASFISFNAQVDGAIIEKDAMVSGLSRVGPGVTIPSGLKTIAGRNIESQAEVAAETTPVTEADREFMSGVIHVNEAFELSYAQLAEEKRSNVKGINYDPGGNDFNPERDLPVLAGTETRDPRFRNRIIGAVSMVDTYRRLDRHLGRNISLRADEGEPFSIGSILCMGNRTTFHALEHTSLELGDAGCYGFRSIVHGGPTDNDDITTTGDGFTLGAYSVYFRSTAGNDVSIGYRSLVQNTNLPDGAVVPARTVIVDGGVVGSVEW